MAEDPFVSSAPNQQPHIYRPIPRRHFSTNSHSSTNESPDPFTQPTPPTSNASGAPGEFLAQLNARLLRSRNANTQHENGGPGGASIRNNRSFLNMTSSTLFGIYDDVGTSTAGERSETETPWGTGAETPARHSLDSGLGINGWDNGVRSTDGGLRMKGLQRRGTVESTHRRPGLRPGHAKQRQGIWKVVAIVGKLMALGLFGVVYGVIVSHLHDTRELAAVNVGVVGRESGIYLASWGFAGVLLGSLLPYVDLLWEGERLVKQEEVEREEKSDWSVGEQWNEVGRSVGAFVGIAFAIRKLPWQSTLQLSLTLALVNPALWYILDRSKPGLSFSLTVSSILTSFILLSNPDVLPSPSLPATTNSTHLPTASRGREAELFAGMVSYESLAVATWVGSVLFCSCVCFGSIGRRLAILDEWGWR
ncbi:hypothetical protein K469DRAFT_708346 [Zopfia rhizophila CBS 207.26]|uniref:INSIG domain-containing protein n=1 Tax=Zopfia rhizophila CBS 207.26 TaxID=1314779 RepID=A0A6A6DZT7_9PEZI|nr:hypothetical protein K469DRAFT_708346 [Zopfia rhizophila CBS 207.26]